ncbi:MAG: peptidylprolyl isomerase [Draconibacterium sp.]|nr:MAG: peptidylprolyl isomerase [Draconibacterium sp.]
MATLQTIRTKAGLLVAIVIGISLAAFILGDMLQSGSSLLRKNQMEIGEVNGESIQYPAFQQKVEELGEIYKQNLQQNQLDENTWVQVREQTWQNNVRDIIMNDVYDDLGIKVSDDELFDMIQGNNLHPIIRQLFQNPNTGQVDRNAIVGFLKNLETSVNPDQKNYWLYIEDQISEDRTMSKYVSMVGKGLYVTTKQAEETLNANKKTVNFDYVSLPVNTVPDSAVTITEKDLKKYYDEHLDSYEQGKSRKISYITFPVNPSQSDYTDAEKWINEIKTDFENTKETVHFVNSNSDESYVGTWYKQNNLAQNVGNWIFVDGANVNDVLGPYTGNDRYILAKLVALEMMPDSVKARHILLQVNSQQELAAKQQLADSLKTAIEKGSNFAALAREFSKDPGSAALGGDLGWFSRGQMVKPFEDAAFSNKKNEVAVVISQFGIHIVQTTKLGKLSKQAQVAFLVRKVEPSTRTYQNVYSQASKFAGKNRTGKAFEAAIADQGLNKKVATLREEDRNIAGLENSRQLIRAAFDTKEGNVILTTQESPIFELGDNFVIAVLDKETSKGTAPFDDVRARVELSVMKEKKIEYLMQKAEDAVQGKSDIQEIASILNSSTQSANNIGFNSFSIPGLGNEPSLVGALSTLEKDKVSQPVAGNNGVYVLYITAVNEQQNADVAQEKLNLAQSLFREATSEAYNARREAAKIVDKRSKFY